MMFSKCSGSRSSSMLSLQINIAGVIHFEGRSIESNSSWKKSRVSICYVRFVASCLILLGTYQNDQLPAFPNFTSIPTPTPTQDLSAFISVRFLHRPWNLQSRCLERRRKTTSLMPFGLEVFQAPKMATKRLRFRIEGKLARKLSYLNSLLGLITASL